MNINIRDFPFSGAIWSDRVLEKLPLRERYPITEGESEQEYAERLELISSLSSEDEDDTNESNTEEVVEDLDNPSKELFI